MPFATNMNVPQIFGTEPGKEFSLFSPQENKVYKFKRLWKTMLLYGIQSDDLHLCPCKK